MMVDDASRITRTPRCNDRGAIKSLLEYGRPVTVLITGTEVHIWWPETERPEPEPGTACACGARTWR